MKFGIIAVGKLKERFWQDACAEYLRRLQPYAHTSVKEIPDIDPARAGGIAQALEKEGTSILAALPASTHIILLDIGGRERSSVEFSAHLDELALQGKSDFTFVIGGSSGVSEAVYARADETFSFGRITLPHNLARVVLLEQLYRAMKISHGEPYHK